MSIDISASPVRARRRIRRRPALLLAVGLAVVLGSWAAPAAADPPETWEESSAGGGELFLILGGLALAVIAVIALLTYLPSMMRHNQTTEPALAFRERSEWFGGPRQGLEDAAEPGTSGETRDSARGGGSAHW